MHLKDRLKTLAHRLPFIPYRKPSKRFRQWDKTKEMRFLKKLDLATVASGQSFDTIKASVVMPAYNRAFCIGNAIESVRNQSHANWELIVVDDGSTDNLQEVLSKYKDEKRIRVLTQEHGGVSRARNTGVDASEGDYVFYLDTDNIWHPGYLRTMIVFMELGELDLCYSGARIIGDKNKIVGYFGEEFNWHECHELNHVDLNTLGHRKTLWNKGCRFDEDLKRLVDWDFILAASAGHRIAYAPFLGVDYYDGEQGSRITYTRHTGEDIREIIQYIQDKNKPLIDDRQISEPSLRPRWNAILNNPTKNKNSIKVKQNHL